MNRENELAKQMIINEKATVDAIVNELSNAEFDARLLHQGLCEKLEFYKKRQRELPIIFQNILDQETV